MLSSCSIDSGIGDNELVSRAKAGDSAALSLLIEKYSDFILKKASSFKNLSGIDVEDLYQEGMIGFVSSIYSFDEAYGTKFSSYSSIVYTRKMLSALRINNNNVSNFSDFFVSIDDCEFSSNNPSPEEVIMYNEELCEIIEFSKDNFSKTEKKVFKLILLGASNSEISEILDCSLKSVENSTQRIRRKLRSRK